MRKKMGIIVLMAVLLGVVAISQMTGERLLNRIEQKKSIPTAGKTSEKVVVIDSGHGGSDPGKIGINNVLEKDINLQIAKKIQKLMKENGVKAVMTREDDGSLKESKVEDLKARVELINQTKPILTVSIHQNSYPEESIHGAQMFYYTHSKEGERAAKILQEALREIDPENHRQAKANDTYYMLKKTETPVVIVECGFLSNQKETEQLCNEEYQQQIAQAVTDGIMDYYLSLEGSKKEYME